ncbi:MAG: glutathione-disulfide reductase [Alphaproteobacteria bacterium]|nr:MAG: glutathione-disulfide reductase [Alphaproteobacteria bacterium]
MTDFDYDLFTIGAGSGGVRASRMAANFGARVAVAEEYRVGGTCVIRGCVPKKLFVYASHYSGHFKEASGYGWDVGERRFNWQTLMRNKDQEIDRLNGIYIRNLKNAGVEIIDSRAVVKGPHTVELVQEGREVTAKNILIATGGWPFRDHSVPGCEHAVTSNEVFEMPDLPDRIMVVGGGYIAVEFASIFHGLGVETCLVYRGEQILRGFDDDLRNGLHEAMTRKGIDVETQANLKEIVKTDGGFDVTLTNGKVISTGLVMTAIGRNPNSRGLGLEAVGVECAANGAICVDEYSQTSVPSIYAVGDVTDRVNLTPVAIKEGAAFAQTVFNNNPIRPEYDLIPTAVFSQPEIGTIGMTEAEARAQFGEVDIYRSTFNPMKNILSEKHEPMMMKLIVEPKSDKILGVHIMGPDSGEMIQCLGIAVKMGATKADFDATMPVHPTAAEELVTLSQKVS